MKIAFKVIDVPHDLPIYAPYFRCDVCGQIIEDARQGMIKWDSYTEPSSQLIVHKGRCDQQSPGGDRAHTRWPWRELRTLLEQLDANYVGVRQR